MPTHTYSIALPTLPEEYAYALDPATGCVVFRPHRKDEWYLSPVNNQPTRCGYDCRDSQLILVKAPEGYRFKRDLEGKAIYRHCTQYEAYLNDKGEAHDIPTQGWEGNRDWPPGQNPRTTKRYFILEKLPEPIPAPPEGFEWVLDENGDRVKRVPEEGDWWSGSSGRTPLLQQEYDETGREAPWCHREAFILKKIKPSYTEAVKATGWKWPFHAQYPFGNYDHLGNFTLYAREPYRSNDSIWLTNGMQCRASAVVTKAILPPRLADDYPWQETLLCIDDFEV